MKLELINQTYLEERTEFKQRIIKRKWDILILVVEGEYSVTIPEKQCSLVLKKNDIMFLPANMEIEREVLSPLTCYHLTFSMQMDHPFLLVFYRISVFQRKFNQNLLYLKALFAMIKQNIAICPQFLINSVKSSQDIHVTDKCFTDKRRVPWYASSPTPQLTLRLPSWKN